MYKNNYICYSSTSFSCTVMHFCYRSTNLNFQIFSKKNFRCTRRHDCTEYQLEKVYGTSGYWRCSAEFQHCLHFRLLYTTYIFSGCVLRCAMQIADLYICSSHIKSLHILVHFSLIHNVCFLRLQHLAMDFRRFDPTYTQKAH